MAAEYVKIPELAHRLDVSEKTARRYVKEGKLPSVFIGGAFRVSEEDLKEFLEGAKVDPGKALAPPSLEEAEEAGQTPDEGRRYPLALFDTQARLMREASVYYGPLLEQLPEDPPLEDLASKYIWVIHFSFVCDLFEKSINAQPFAEIAGLWVDHVNEEGTPPEIRRSVDAFQAAYGDLLGTRHNQALAWIWKQRERYQKQLEEGHAEFDALLHTFGERLSKTRG